MSIVSQMDEWKYKYKYIRKISFNILYWYTNGRDVHWRAVTGFILVRYWIVRFNMRTSYLSYISFFPFLFNFVFFFLCYLFGLLWFDCNFFDWSFIYWRECVKCSLSHKLIRSFFIPKRPCTCHPINLAGSNFNAMRLRYSAKFCAFLQHRVSPFFFSLYWPYIFFFVYKFQAENKREEKKTIIKSTVLRSKTDFFKLGILLYSFNYKSTFINQWAILTAFALKLCICSNYPC